MMMTIKNILTFAIATVWFVNGFFCKVLNLVPRHELIVSQILGETYATIATKAIGISEVFMVIWIFSGIKSRWCALFQIAIVLIMNIIEFILVPDLLLFGRANAVVAIFFVSVVFINEFASTFVFRRIR